MLYEITVPQFAKMLQNLLNIMGKGVEQATEKKFEFDVLLNSRLAPDQFNFIRQVQIATDTAKLCCFRLTGVEAPAHADNEKNLSELQSRIHEVITYLHKLTPHDFVGAEQKKISQPRWEGKYLLGSEYVLQHAIPNFYFHITTAYAILRHNGVNVGKSHYLGELPYKK